MPRKPVPLPVATTPDYPSLQDATARAEEAMGHSPGEHPAYIGCPNCGSQVWTAKPAIRPTAYDAIQCLKCPDCGWTGSIPSSGCY